LLCAFGVRDNCGEGQTLTPAEFEELVRKANLREPKYSSVLQKLRLDIPTKENLPDNERAIENLPALNDAIGAVAAFDTDGMSEDTTSVIDGCLDFSKATVAHASEAASATVSTPQPDITSLLDPNSCNTELAERETKIAKELDETDAEIEKTDEEARECRAKLGDAQTDAERKKYRDCIRKTADKRKELEDRRETLERERETLQQTRMMMGLAMLVMGLATGVISMILQALQMFSPGGDGNGDGSGREDRPSSKGVEAEQARSDDSDAGVPQDAPRSNPSDAPQADIPPREPGDPAPDPNVIKEFENLEGFKVIPVNNTHKSNQGYFLALDEMNERYVLLLASEPNFELLIPTKGVKPFESDTMVPDPLIIERFHSILRYPGHRVVLGVSVDGKDLYLARDPAGRKGWFLSTADLR